MRLILALILSFFITPAFAQSGHLASGQVFGNATGSEALGSPTLLGPLLDQGYTCTAQGSIMMRGASLWSCLGPGSTAGKPLVSGGAGANLTYSTLTVVGGGTGLATLSSNAIYKGNGTSAIATSALTDNGTIVSSSESIDVTTFAQLQEIPNAGSTGTTVNKLAKLTGSPSTAVIATTSDTTGNVLGIVTGGAGTTGNAQIAITGQASCVFDGSITAGHYVSVSVTSGGDCHDNGATLPTSGQILGLIIAATNASPGSTPQAVTLFPPGIVGTTGTSSGTVTTLTAGAGIAFSSGTTCTSTCTVSTVSTGPTTQLFTTTGANQTYTRPAGVLWIKIRLKGPGGGGGASGSGGTSGSAAATGTCWNTTGTACTTPVFLASSGGGGVTSGGGGAGGTCSGTGTIGFQYAGTTGSNGTGSLANFPGGNGGGQGAGSGGSPGSAGANGTANTGGGGGGGASNAAAVNTGAGGGEGCYQEGIILNPASTYVFTIPAGGATGSAGTNGFIGGVGGSGYVTVEEHYVY